MGFGTKQSVMKNSFVAYMHGQSGSTVHFPWNIWGLVKYVIFIVWDCLLYLLCSLCLPYELSCLSCLEEFWKGLIIFGWLRCIINAYENLECVGILRRYGPDSKTDIAFYWSSKGWICVLLILISLHTVLLT